MTFCKTTATWVPNPVEALVGGGFLLNHLEKTRFKVQLRGADNAIYKAQRRLLNNSVATDPLIVTLRNMPADDAPAAEDAAGADVEPVVAEAVEAMDDNELPVHFAPAFCRHLLAPPFCVFCLPDAFGVVTFHCVLSCAVAELTHSAIPANAGLVSRDSDWS